MIDVEMPQMGESIVEGTLTKWLKKPGERWNATNRSSRFQPTKWIPRFPRPRREFWPRFWSRKGRRSASTPWSARSTMARPSVGPSAQTSAGGASATPVEQAPPRAQWPRSAAARAAATTCHCSGEHQCSAASGCTGLRHSRTPEPCRRNAGPAVAAGPQDGAREQHRSEPGERHRCRRAHHQAGPGNVHGAAGRAHRGERHCASVHTQAPAAYASAVPQQPGRPSMPAVPPAPAEMPPLPRAEAARNARRAHERHAPEDRRAHGVQQAHLGACDHGPQSRHDQASPSCATS